MGVGNDRDDGAEGDGPTKPSYQIHQEMAEPLKIRRLLTLYVSSLIRFPDGNEVSHAQLCMPDAALEVKAIPKEVEGLRRQYLEKLRANIAARNRYRELLNVKSGTVPTKSRLLNQGNDQERLNTHLEMLSMRKHYQRLHVVQHYLEKLTETNQIEKGVLDLDRSQGNGATAEETSIHASMVTKTLIPQEKAEDLSRKLELAVLRAKHQLERERALLAEVKERRNAESGNGMSDSDRKAYALSVIRDELVRWLEERMSKLDIDDEEHPPAPESTGIEDQSNHLSIREDIMIQYEKYLEARTKLLQLMAFTSSLEQSEEAKPDHTPVERLFRPDTESQEPSSFSFIGENIINLLQSQKSLASQKSYITRTINQETLNSIEVLERLRDESHLLPAYPLIAGEDRFKNARAVFGSGNLQRPQDQKDDIVRLAEAWAFAARESSMATDELVSRHVQDGEKHLDLAEGWLAELDELLEGDEQIEETDEDAERSEDAGTGDLDPQTRLPRKARQPTLRKGIWGGLRADVGT